MTNRSKMILGLASLLGVTAGATAVSGFAWFVTTKTADVAVTNIGVYNNNPSLSVTINNLAGVKRTNTGSNDFDLEAAKDSTSVDHEFTANGTDTSFILPNKPLAAPTVYVNGVVDATHTYDAASKTISFTDAPAADTKIRAVYYDSAALTDVSSMNGVDFYDPTWQAAYEGTKATLIPPATAGEQYIAFDLNFAAVDTGSLNIFLDRPTIEGLTSDADDVAAADVARVAFSIGGTNVLTISNNVGDDYKKGIDGSLLGNATTVSGDYTVASYLANCENLVVPSTEDYSVKSTVAQLDAAHNYIATVSDAPVIVHVTIWLEGTSNVDLKGNYSDPIGGEIDVHLPIVAFNA